MMSEYWKSTPKYWCKRCKTFVRDTKLERTNHDATPKHQGNLKRFLRDLYREHENEARQKECARAEVARLNGVSSSTSPFPNGGENRLVHGQGRGVYGRPPQPKIQATEKQRKEQLSQLVELGISVPDEYRGDLAMAGDWTVLKERVVEEDEEADEAGVDRLALGVRKREELEDEDEKEAKRAKWGRAYKTGPLSDTDIDLDTLLEKTRQRGNKSVKMEIKEEDGRFTEPHYPIPATVESEVANDKVPEVPPIKKEHSQAEQAHSLDTIPIPAIKTEGLEDAPLPGVVFKKRKAKNIRQK